MVKFDRPLSITHIISNLDTGGAEMMLYRLLSILDRKLFEPAVISLTGIGPVGKKIEKLRIPVLALRMRRNSPNPWHLFRLARWCRRSRADIVQTWMYHADLLGLLAAKLTGTPKLVWTIRSSDIPFNSYRPQTGLLAKLCSVLSSVPDGIVANSNAGIRHHAALGYPPRLMRLIPNGFDVECFRPDAAARLAVRRELGLQEKTLIIGLVARWDSLKDHSMFMEAVWSVYREYKDIYFVLVGRGIEWQTPELAALIRTAGLQDRTILLGERDDIPRLTAAFDIACSSSITEGFPTTIGEAMACGVPCVVTDVGDAAAIVGDAGRVVPAGDGVAFAQACKELISLGSHGRRDLGARGRERIVEKYSLSSIVKQYEELYFDLVSAARVMIKSSP